MTKTTTMTSGLAAVALAAIVTLLPACERLRPNTVPVEVVSYMPDGSLVLFTPGGIRVYDGQLVVEQTRIPLEALATSPVRGGFRYSLSADGTTAAVSYSNYVPGAEPRVGIYRIPSGELLNMFRISAADGVDQLALSPNGELLCALVLTRVGRTTTMLDTATGTPLWVDEMARRIPVWSNDGMTLFARGDVNIATPNIHALDARTGTLKWRTDLEPGTDVQGLSLVDDGALLAGAAATPDVQGCQAAGDCPPVFPFWSASDGTSVMQLAGVPHNLLYAAGPSENYVFACNQSDTCAAGLRDYSREEQPKSAHIYKTDGTVLMTVPAQGASPSIAISPDGAFIAIDAEAGEQGGATVFRIADGAVAGFRDFPVDTF